MSEKANDVIGMNRAQQNCVDLNVEINGPLCGKKTSKCEEQNSNRVIFNLSQPGAVYCAIQGTII